jgi:hypothetical protein
MAQAKRKSAEAKGPHSPAFGAGLVAALRAEARAAVEIALSKGVAVVGLDKNRRRVTIDPKTAAKKKGPVHERG